MRYWLLILAFVLASCTPKPADIVADVMSPEEIAYIKAHPILRMGADKHYPPIVFVDETGMPIGLSVDFLAEISKILNIKFETRLVGNRAEVLEALKSKQIDLTFANRSAVGRPYLITTQPYIYDKGVILVRKGKTYEDIKTIATYRGAAANKYLETFFPAMQRNPMETHEHGVLALMHDKVDGTILGKEMVYFYRDKFKLDMSQYDLLPVDYEYQLAFGVHVDNVVLCGIMIKALDAIPLAKRRELLHRWLREPYL